MGFSNTVEMELSSTRLARALEPQIQSVSSLTAAPLQAVPGLLSGPPPTASSLTSGQNQALSSLTGSHLQTMPSLMRGTARSMPNLISEASRASNYCQAGPNLMSGPRQAVPSLAICPPQSTPLASDVQPDTGASGSPGPGRAAGGLCSGDGADPSMGNTLCKVSPGKMPFNYLCSSQGKKGGPWRPYPGFPLIAL